MQFVLERAFLFNPVHVERVACATNERTNERISCWLVDDKWNIAQSMAVESVHKFITSFSYVCSILSALGICTVVLALITPEWSMIRIQDVATDGTGYSSNNVAQYSVPLTALLAEIESNDANRPSRRKIVSTELESYTMALSTLVLLCAALTIGILNTVVSLGYARKPERSQIAGIIFSCSASLFLFGGLVMFYEGSAEISNQITFQNNFVININRVTSSFWLAFAGFMLFAVCLTLHMVNSVLLCFCCPQLEKYKQMQQTDDTPSKDYPGLFFGGTILGPLKPTATMTVGELGRGSLSGSVDVDWQVENDRLQDQDADQFCCKRHTHTHAHAGIRTQHTRTRTVHFSLVHSFTRLILRSKEKISKRASISMMKQSLVVLRLTLHALGGILTTIGIGLIVAGTVTPAWQVVNVTEMHAYREHGLWMDCVYGTDRNLAVHQSNPGMACTFKLDKHPASPVADTGNDHWFHVTTLALLCSAAGLGLVGLSMFCCAYCIRVAYIFWAVNTGICMVLACSAVIMFFHVANEFQHRMLHTLTEVYEQKMGYSFWLAVAGSAVYVACLLVNVLCAIIVYVVPSTHTERPRGWMMVNQHEDTLV
ncbi:Clc-like protein 2 [Trichinella spiralis]|uniref:Clc-like protein 2 n=2 Tax=Trichinella spiralis TaxID=6334 RepID=A0A0V1C101_TRISP|nr:Clc-like protein 2 [Trichinella spiralis]